MKDRETTVSVWFAAIAGLATALYLVYSPRARYEVARAAQRLADSVNSGIQSLQSRLQPRYGRQMAVLEEVSQTLDSATTQFESSMIVSKVGSALASEPRLQGRRVGVRMIGGILHLEGDVRTQDEKALASEVARKSSGAELVANDLRVGIPTG